MSPFSLPNSLSVVDEAPKSSSDRMALVQGIRPIPAAILSSSLFLAACAGGEQEADISITFGSVPITASGTDEMMDDDTTSTEEGESGADSMSDTFGDGDGDQELPFGCSDFSALFIVDPSGSMFEEHAELQYYIPDWIESIRGNNLGLEDGVNVTYNIASDKTDAEGAFCVPCENDEDTCFIGQQGENPIDLCDPENECHSTLGGLYTWSSSQPEPCLPEGGPRYIQGPPNPGEEALELEQFECIAVPFYGPNAHLEMQLDTIYNAVKQDYIGGCAEGFLPKKGPLSIVLLTDERDRESVHSPGEVVDAIREAMGGTLKYVSFVGVTLQGTHCNENYDSTAPKIDEFAEALEEGGASVEMVDICDTGAVEIALDRALDQLEETCNAYQPVG